MLGLILEVKSRGSGQFARGRAGCGILLNLLAMLGRIIGDAVLLAAGAGWAIWEGNFSTVFGG